MPLIRARLCNVFEMWITCSEKEAKWKLNNPDLSEPGKSKQYQKKRAFMTEMRYFHPFQLHIQWSRYGLIRKKKLSNHFVQNILRKLQDFKCSYATPDTRKLGKQ